MNSSWKANLIIFTMVVLPTVLILKSKLGFLVPLKVNLGSNLVEVDENHQVAPV